MSEPPGAGSDLVAVEMREIPVQVWARTQEHADELIREMTLIAARPLQPGHELPRQLSELIDRLTAEYGGLGDEQDAALAQAAADGVETLDLTWRLPPGVTGAVVELGDMLDAADDYCRAGQHLLTLATPPEALAYRRWFLGEIIRQLAGEAPQSWPDWIRQEQSPLG